MSAFTSFSVAMRLSKMASTGHSSSSSHVIAQDLTLAPRQVDTQILRHDAVGNWNARRAEAHNARGAPTGHAPSLAPAQKFRLKFLEL